MSCVRERQVGPASVLGKFSVDPRARAFRYLNLAFPDMLDYMCVANADDTRQLIVQVERYLLFHRHMKRQGFNSRLQLFKPDARPGVLHWLFTASMDAVMQVGAPSTQALALGHSRRWCGLASL